MPPDSQRTLITPISLQQFLASQRVSTLERPEAMLAGAPGAEEALRYLLEHGLGAHSEIADLRHGDRGQRSVRGTIVRTN